MVAVHPLSKYPWFISDNFKFSIFSVLYFIDCTKLVPLSFKFQPPKLTASSVPKSNPSCDNKAQTLPSESLLEFLPKYSGKSCQALKFELNRCSCSQSGSDERVSVQWTSDLQVLYTEDHGLPIQSNQQPKLASTGKDSSGKNKLLQEVLDPLDKSVSRENHKLYIIHLYVGRTDGIVLGGRELFRRVPIAPFTSPFPPSSQA